MLIKYLHYTNEEAKSSKEQPKFDSEWDNNCPFSIGCTEDSTPQLVRFGVVWQREIIISGQAGGSLCEFDGNDVSMSSNDVSFKLVSYVGASGWSGAIYRSRKGHGR